MRRHRWVSREPFSHRHKDGTPKRPYTQEEAKQEAQRLGACFYPCRSCPCWHIGSRAEARAS